MSIEARFSLPQQIEVGAVQEQQAHGLTTIPLKLDRIENQREAQIAERIARPTGKFFGWFGSVPEWLMGADCKSAGLPTLVQIQFGPIFLFLDVAVVEW